jgi:hypothetical protein
MTCPDFRTLVDLREGELAERVALEVRTHLASCQSCGAESHRLDALCRGIAAPLASGSSLSVGSIVAALGEPAPRAAPSTWRRPGALLALAAALLAVVTAGAWWSPQHQHGFTARGGGVKAVDAMPPTSVEPLAGEPPRRITGGETVSGSTRFSAQYRNLGQTDAHLLLFVIDSRSEVHWIYPAYRSQGEDPVAVPLPASSNGLLSEAVGFDDLAAGNALIVSVISPAPTRVRQVEALAEPSPVSVLRLFPGAVVRATPIVVSAP